jgi:putative pyruvate formate lyase activating enzyme
MQRQVGDLKVDDTGVAIKGLLIRHLVLPYRIAGSFEVLKFIVENLSKESYVNIMLQYRPCYHGDSYPELALPLKREEYQKVIDYAHKLGFHRSF